MISVSRLAPVESAPQNNDFSLPASLPWNNDFQSPASLPWSLPENNDFSLPPRSRGVCTETMISVSRLAPVDSAPQNNDFSLHTNLWSAPPRSRGSALQNNDFSLPASLRGVCTREQ
ncbi:hypothetical protein RRG08_065159 [Elysia crispata]|nr:hypothetical protein RRG08_065159 [Elysia crispata]